MPALKPETMKARRADILDAAMRCFAREGYRGTSMRDICQEAQVSIGGVYVHFRSKEDILTALADSFRDEREAVHAEVPKGKSAAANIAATLRAMTRDLETPEGSDALHADVVMMGEALNIPLLKDILVQTDREHFAAFGQLLKGETFRGIQDNSQLSHLVTGSLFGLIILAAYHDNFDRDGYIGALEALLEGAEQSTAASPSTRSEIES